MNQYLNKTMGFDFRDPSRTYKPKRGTSMFTSSQTSLHTPGMIAGQLENMTQAQMKNLSTKDINDYLKVGRQRLYPNPTKKTYYQKEQEATDKALQSRSNFLKSVQTSVRKQNAADEDGDFDGEN